ncbi:MAG: hypothetical protein ACFFG0_47955 [Candidatus Thorarchaeota archaeon]
MNKEKKIKVFQYVDSIDCFLVTKEYEEIADYIGLTEWNPVVWIGRLFMLDNDYGEHWFDDWEEREQREEKVKELKINIESDKMMVVDPDRFQNKKDGPCHTSDFRKRFWTDVLMSLELSLDLLFDRFY